MPPLDGSASGGVCGEKPLGSCIATELCTTPSSIDAAAAASSPEAATAAVDGGTGVCPGLCTALPVSSWLGLELALIDGGDAAVVVTGVPLDNGGGGGGAGRYPASIETSAAASRRTACREHAAD